MITIALRQLPDFRYAARHGEIEALSRHSSLAAVTLLADLLRRAGMCDVAWKVCWPDGRVEGAGASLHDITGGDMAPKAQDDLR